MEHTEKEFLDGMLSKLSKNKYSHISSSEYIDLNDEFKGKWLKKSESTSMTCNKCFGKNCRIEINSQEKFMPCPHGVAEIITVNNQDRFFYAFDLELFFSSIRTGMNLKSDNVKYKEFYILGHSEFKKSNWKVVFTFGRHLERSIGDLIEFQLKNETSFTVMLVDKLPRVDDFKLSIFQNLGVFLLEWKEYDKALIETIYQTKRAEIEVRKEIEEYPIEDVKQKLLATLERAATSGDGDWFEDEVYKTFKKVTPHIVPFGAQYKGFSIPDGMIFGSNNFPFPTLFYDCKSSATDDYAIKSGVAMQVNYYVEFLNHFYSQPKKYENYGFVIFAEAFNPIIQKRIEGSPQWKLVQEKCKLFYINRECLDRIEKFISLYGADGRFDSIDIFDICFGEKIARLEDSQTQEYYAKIFPTSSFNQFRYLKPEQFEIAFVSAVINHFYKNNIVNGTRDDLKEALRKSNHDNKRRRGIKRPVLFPFLEDFINMAKKDTDISPLYPLTTLLVINRTESDLIEILGEDTVNKIAEKAEQKITTLIDESFVI